MKESKKGAGIGWLITVVIWMFVTGGPVMAALAVAGRDPSVYGFVSFVATIFIVAKMGEDGTRNR